MRASQFMRLFLVAILILAARAVAQTGVNADQTVETVDLAEFEGLTPEQLWHQLNGLPYWSVPRRAPAAYYDDAETSSSQALRDSLHAIIQGHDVFPYSTSSDPFVSDHKVDTWDIIAIADAHPENPARVIDLYLNGTFDRQLRGVTTNPRYDREHSWPKSLGFPNNTRRNSAYSDCHHLFAAYNSYNSSRSNKPYGTGDNAADRRKPTLENLGRGGGLSEDEHGANYSYTDVFQTWIGRRGDVARAMFYMDVRYAGSDPDDEADLQLTNDAEQVATRNVWESGGTAFMGLSSVLIQWHMQDPVDDLERRRNAVVFLFQGNRNPFVDHPEWADSLFGEAPPPPCIPGSQDIWINEFHYDNKGPDGGEFVEIAGPAGTDVTGWTIVGYNGNGGQPYKTIMLVGTIPAQQNDFGTLSFDFQGLQNGGPDGLALIAPDGRVVQFLTYEGHFTAGAGPASGEIGNDIGVSEKGNTPLGHSLQLQGQGRSASSFTWARPAAATRGSVNTGQVFEASP